MTEHNHSPCRVFVWDLDETLIIFQTLANGRYAHHFKGLKDTRYGIKLGRRWEKLIIQVCDDYFFYEQIEEYNQPTIQTWSKYDDGMDLSGYDFQADRLSEDPAEINLKKLAYRHRKISHFYKQGLETLLNEEQLHEWKELYELTDSYTDGWLTAGRNILKHCMRADAHNTDVVAMPYDLMRSVNVLVTSGSLVPSLIKVLLFKLDEFITDEYIYSSTQTGKLQCFKWIRDHFNKSNTRFCVIGDGIDECDAAQAMAWPFVKIDTVPDAPIRLPSLTLATIECYMRVIYGDDESVSK